jgi:hypothetical protein
MISFLQCFIVDATPKMMIIQHIDDYTTDSDTLPSMNFWVQHTSIFLYCYLLQDKLQHAVHVQKSTLHLTETEASSNNTYVSNVPSVITKVLDLNPHALAVTFKSLVYFSQSCNGWTSAHVVCFIEVVA